MNTPADSFDIGTNDGHRISGTLWPGNGLPNSVIQIFHGLGEHRARYGRFGALANAAGMAVVCHDHRGHGGHADLPGYFADKNGWQRLISDGLLVTEHIENQFGDRPIVLLGHSMGSYIAQSYAMRHSGHIAALVLSASTWPQKRKLIPGRLLAKFEGLRLGKQGRSAFLDKLGFGDFNKPYKPARTELDWLSRDPSEVDQYIEDPLCGGPYTCGLWSDLMGGLLEIGSDKALARIPAELPILLTGGSDDPVGGQKGITALEKHYATTGHEELTCRIYPGGRHEMFNETNRDEFSTDVLQWILSKLPRVTGV